MLRSPPSRQSHAERIQLANKAVMKLWESVNKSWYPEYHIAPYAGWMNDPNGLVYHEGMYHLFYQHHPFSSSWGPAHWGHLTSPDLIHWQHQPVALAPGEEYDRDGCFSGSAFSFEGKLYLAYTGHVDLTPSSREREAIYQQQCLAVSEDGIHFDKLGPVVRPPAGFMHFRDPKVWFQHGRWWMVCGARSNLKDLGMAILYSTDDFLHWDDRTYTILAQTDDRNVFMWEVPDFFPMGDAQVLLLCPQGKRSEDYQYRNRFQSGTLVGHWVPGEPFLPFSNFHVLDLGHDFYAVQSFEAPDGRRILFAWMDMWDSPMPCKRHGWSGVFTLPRELSLDVERGRLCMRPIEELKRLRDQHGVIEPQEVMENSQVVLVPNCTAFEVEIKFSIQNSTAEKYGLWLGSGAQFYVDDQSRRLVLSRHYPEHMVSGYRSCPLPSAALLTLRVFIDRCSMEVFVNNGDETFSSRIYPENEDRVLYLFAVNGTASVLGGDVYSLSPCITH